MTSRIVLTCLGLGAVVALGGCEERPRPWSRGDGPPAVLAPRASGAGGGAQGEGGGALDASGGPGDTAQAPTAAPASSTESPAPVDAPAEPAARLGAGGAWVKCHEGLALSGDPLKDVTRLGLLCGPSSGMRRKTRQAIVGIVGEREPPVVTKIQVAAGACYRIFAAADADVGDLDVSVRSSRDAGIAADHGKGRLAIVQPDRPFCALADDALAIEISTKRGGGRFAAEVWALGEPRRKGDPTEAAPDEAPLDKP